MSTLYKRANEKQRRIFRIVAGAVISAAHAHPDWVLDGVRLAEAVAKRATGTLSAQWAEVLATPDVALSERPRAPSLVKGATFRPCSTRLKRAGGDLSSRVQSPTSLAYVQKVLGAMVGEARRAGQVEREATLKDVLRIVAKIKEHQGPVPKHFDIGKLPGAG